MAARLIDRLTMARSQLSLPRRTVRLRLTILYSGLFLLAGAALLAITYVLFERSTATALFVNSTTGQKIAVKGSLPTHVRPSPQLHNGRPTAEQLRLAAQLGAQAGAQHAHDLQQLLIQSAIALAVMAVLAIALGWIVAGRVLTPLRTMADKTQQISERNLHERLALAGPDDEVKHLADTIDGLLARLETAFDAQRHFVANASHELRTPLGFNCALLEVALGDPNATAETLRSTCQELLESGEQQERLVEALLTLASSEQGLDQWERFDLAVVTQRALSPHRADAKRRQIDVNATLDPAPMIGSPELVERMAANLIDNAIRHNTHAGSIDILTYTQDRHAVLSVSNTGPQVTEADVDRLFEPFQRLGNQRTTDQDGYGLGLSIIRAIATAHHAGIKLQLRPEGGLTIQVHLPPPSSSANGPGDDHTTWDTAAQLRKARSPIRRSASPRESPKREIDNAA